MLVYLNPKATPALVLGLLCAVPACTGNFHKKWADREVFGILRTKSGDVPNAGKGLLDISPPPPVSLDKLAKNFTTVEFLGDKAEVEKDARVITLTDALQYGVERNRTYLGQKENLYLTALDLTGVRHEFALIPYAKGNSEYVASRAQSSVNQFVTTRTLTAHGDTGFSALQSSGAVLATNLSTDFVRLLTGKLTNASDSKFAASLTQPLLRGAGALAVTEPLTQAERDVLYSIRDFTQYRKNFTISVATQFYQTLQNRDKARNAFLAYQAFKKMIDEQAALTDANRPGRTLTSLGLLKQAELTYHRTWIGAVLTYVAALDDLKITLGLPVEQRILLDQHELDKLELINPPGSLDEAMTTAQTTRLDLWNQRDTVTDAERHVKVAKQNLLPSVNTVVKYSAQGDPRSNGMEIDSRRHQFSAGLDVDLHLDQKPVRNDLRAAQIAEQRARRNLELAEDNIRRDVRASWRNLGLAREQYELAEVSIKLNKSRLALEEQLDVEGRGQSRDLIDAQAALIQSNDDRIAALISHTIARVQLWRDMGILFIKKDGRWADVLLKERPLGNHE